MSDISERTYAILNLSGDWLTEELLSQLQAQGVIQTSLASLRKSQDQSKAVLKWIGNPASLPQDKIIFQGTINQISQYLIENSAEWEPNG